MVEPWEQAGVLINSIHILNFLTFLENKKDYEYCYNPFYHKECRRTDSNRHGVASLDFKSS